MGFLESHRGVQKEMLFSQRTVLTELISFVKFLEPLIHAFSKISLSIVCTFVSEGQEVSGAGISHNLNLSLNNMTIVVAVGGRPFIGQINKLSTDSDHNSYCE